MRSKEEAHDYRYFPEPDLPPLHVEAATIQKIKSEMPELPEHKKARFITQFQLTDYDAETLTSSKELAAFFEKVVQEGASPKLSANWINSELLRELKDVEGDITKSPLTSTQMSSLVKLIEKGTISGKIAKTVFEEMYREAKNGKSLTPESIVEAKGLVQILDNSAIEGWVKEVIAKHPAIVDDYKSGKTKVMGFLVGETMKLSQGKANPPMVQEIMKKLLS
jgi:aspartyl-tRNA(Asn)/glutamyl-tRNA(Gln) amidotransferase subunit B